MVFVINGLEGVSSVCFLSKCSRLSPVVRALLTDFEATRWCISDVQFANRTNWQVKHSVVDFQIP